VFDDGYQTRDFTYVSDIVEANIRAATSEKSVGQIMNIAGGSRVTVRSVLDMLHTISGSNFKVEFEEKQHGDVRDTFASTMRAQNLLGYKPQVNLQDGLRNEFEYAHTQYPQIQIPERIF
jgi:UDP-glucose 4-epimerase